MKHCAIFFADETLRLAIFISARCNQVIDLKEYSQKPRAKSLRPHQLFKKSITDIGIQNWQQKDPKHILQCNRSLSLTEPIMNIVVDFLPYTLLIGAMVARYLISTK